MTQPTTRWHVHHGEALDVLRGMETASVDTLVTDPPAGIGFMGVAWDGYDGKRGASRPARREDCPDFDWIGSRENARVATERPKVVAKQGRAFRAAMTPIFAECLRVLRPGAHALVWALPRVAHWTATALEDAGFEVRDKFYHHYATGFPKGVDVQYQATLQVGVCLSHEPAPHVVECSRFIRLKSDEVKGAFVVALARIPHEVGAALLIRTGRVGGLSVAMATLPSTSPGAVMCSNTVSSWSSLLTVFSDVTRTFITETEIEQIIGLPTWNCAREVLTSKSTTRYSATRLNGCRCPVSVVVRPSNGSDPRSDCIPTCSARAIAGIRVVSSEPWVVDPREVADAPVMEPSLQRRVRELTGTNAALKPSTEEWILCRAPLAEKTIAANVLAHGTGALNIDGCRIAAGGPSPTAAMRQVAHRTGRTSGRPGEYSHTIKNRTTLERFSTERPGEALGRWPSNVVLSHAPECEEVGERAVEGNPRSRPGPGRAGRARRQNGFAMTPDTTTYAGADGLETVEAWQCVEGCPVAELDRQSGDDCGAFAPVRGTEPSAPATNVYGTYGRHVGAFYGDKGGASRFFYCAKPSRAERSTQGATINRHPTVKSVALMRWLCRLITPPGGTVLDPFAGSGTTGIAALAEGFRFVGIERDVEYVKIAKARIEGDAPLFNREATP